MLRLVLVASGTAAVLREAVGGLLDTLPVLLWGGAALLLAWALRSAARPSGSARAT
jgi:hypothetical protein